MLKNINLRVIDTKTIGLNPYQVKGVMDIIEAIGVETFKKGQCLKGNTVKELAIEYIETCIHTYVRGLIWNLDIGSEEFIEEEILDEMKNVYAEFTKDIKFVNVFVGVKPDLLRCNNKDKYKKKTIYLKRH